MELKKIVTISGKGGLFQIIKPAKSAIIVESIDAQKTRFTVGTSARVSVLQEVSIYTLNADGSTPLAEVLQTIHARYPDGITLDTKKATDKELREFLSLELPTYNQEKVYPSDIKKLIVWYNTLLQYSPETFTMLTSSTEEADPEVSKEIKEEVEKEEGQA